MNPTLPSSVPAGSAIAGLKLENFYLEIAEPGGLGAGLCCDRERPCQLCLLVCSCCRREPSICVSWAETRACSPGRGWGRMQSPGRGARASRAPSWCCGDPTAGLRERDCTSRHAPRDPASLSGTTLPSAPRAAAPPASRGGAGAQRAGSGSPPAARARRQAGRGVSSGVYSQPEGQGAALCRRRPSLQQLLCNPRPSPLPPALSPRRPPRLGRAARAAPVTVCACRGRGASRETGGAFGPQGTGEDGG